MFDGEDGNVVNLQLSQNGQDGKVEGQSGPKWEEKENAWWGFFRSRGQLFKWERYKKIKIKEEEEVIEGA